MDADDHIERDEYSVTVRVKLVNYPSIIRDSSFTVYVGGCEITSFGVAIAPVEASYIIGSPEKTFGFYDFI